MLNILEDLIDFIYYVIPRTEPTRKQLEQLKIVAHRGWHNNLDITENTMNSFQKALEENLFGIEFDVRWTKDGVPVIHHDANCLRVWGQNIIISETDFSDLRSSLPDIPSLQEVVNQFGKKIHLFIELKEERFLDLPDKRKTMSDILSGLSAINDFYIISLSTYPVEVFNMFDKSTYLLVSAGLNLLEMSKISLIHKYGGIMGHFLLCSDDVLKKHRGKNQRIGTGFIKTKNCLKREILREVDWVFTNHPWNIVSLIESVDSKNKHIL